METNQPLYNSSSSCHRHHFITLCLAAQLVAMTAAEAQPGKIDLTFGGSGAAVVFFDLGGNLSDAGLGMTLQPDGKVIMVGQVATGDTHADFGAMRVTAEGFLDPTFGLNGRTTIPFAPNEESYDVAWSVALDATGKIVIAGGVESATTTDFGIARLEPSGELDLTFDDDGRATVAFDLGEPRINFATSIAIQADGKIVVAGTAVGSQSQMAVTRLNVDGSVDTTFGGDGRMTVSFGAFDAECSSVMIQPDGAIILAGWTAVPGFGSDFAVARLTSSGNLDTTFDGDGKATIDLGSGDFEEGLSATLDANGRIVVVGRTVAASSRAFGIARLLASGAPDTTFSDDGHTTLDLGPGEDQATDVAVQPNGSILVAGTMQSPANDNNYAIVRLRSNGTIDPGFGNAGATVVSFDLGQDNHDNATALALRPDTGKILVGGYVERSSVGDSDFAIIQLEGDLIFADSFESGDTLAWSQ